MSLTRQEILYHSNAFSSNQSRVDFFGKKFDLTEFFQQKWHYIHIISTLTLHRQTMLSKWMTIDLEWDTSWIAKRLQGYVTLQLHCYNSRLFNSRLYNSKTLQPQDVSTPRLYNPKTLQPQIFTTPDFTTPRLYNPRTFQLQDFTTPRLNNSRCYKPSCFDLKFWQNLLFQLISKCSSKKLIRK